MRYLILISLSLGISGCGGYETKYQASIDKQGAIEELCNLRDRTIECIRDAYSIDDLNDCTDVFKKRHHDIAIRYNAPIINLEVTPQHASNQHLAIGARGRRCIENSRLNQGVRKGLEALMEKPFSIRFYDGKRCIIRLHEDMKRLRGC